MEAGEGCCFGRGGRTDEFSFGFLGDREKEAVSEPHVGEDGLDVAGLELEVEATVVGGDG